MEEGFRRAVALHLAGAAIALGIAGCGDDDGEPKRLEAPTPGPAPVAGAVCGPLNGDTLARRIYVDARSTAPDDAACGTTPAAACRTLQQGIDNCGAPGCSVLVRHGLYETQATTVLSAGTSLYGGCRFDGEPDRAYRTTLHARPPAGAPALLADGGNAPTAAFTVAGLVVVNADETAAGTASIALAVTRTGAATLDRLVLSAGRGGDGTTGASATLPGGPGQGGGSATASGNSDRSAGGGGLSCPSNHVGDAGNGGGGQRGLESWLGGCSHSDPNLPWEYGPLNGVSSGNAAGGVAGSNGDDGIWCPDRPHDHPGEGSRGGDGGAGACGPQAVRPAAAAGYVGGILWYPGHGEDGRAGTPGAGGGGGGAGGSCGETFLTSTGYDAFWGGGGGGGGCGGGLGKGGQQGGASLPLLVSNATVVYGDNAYVPGPGGTGGAGGTGTSGGTGGGPGSGVRSGQTLWWGHYCPGLSGDGGHGGPGGAGSGGAGGNGGPSVGIALAGGSNAPPNRNGIYAGQPGTAGRGGTGGTPTPCTSGPSTPCTGPTGEDGVAGAGDAWLQFPAP